MNPIGLFFQQFERLTANGMHIIATLVDSQKNLQVADLCGGLICNPSGDLLDFYVSKDVWPDFSMGLQKGQKVAIVISSPFSMETYQVKGSIINLRATTEEDLCRSQYWVENFLTCLENIGIPRSALQQLKLQPDLCFNFQIEQIYMQTPMQNTGGQL